MSHLNDDQLAEVYYGEFDAAEHLTACGECSERFDRMREVLDAFKQIPIPARDATHGSAVWLGLMDKLQPEKPKRRWWGQWWVMMPALAALLTVAFLTGRFTERSQPKAISETAGISETARERVLLLSLSDHLEQSQIVLSSVANAEPGSGDLTDERDRAHELLGANRLLRQTAVRLGDVKDAALLDELERVLVNFANSRDLHRTQQQIEEQGLLFKVRVTSVASRERGEKL